MFDVSPDEDYEENFLERVNSRLLCIDVDEYALSRIPSSISSLWNLQTLIINKTDTDYVLDIWKMPQLRHVKISNWQNNDGSYYVPDPLSDEEDMVLENLQTLYIVFNVKFGA
ncbi:hypothetical protein SASPL_108277 [Salvia splendens]|uniref:Uncharacterized protein n=1 Tax=Salvia splendens TaxID=180675 RepID=A0A8X8YBZ8_SALSN|nr:hypothetical protein SASPL_108277 [Salvia splendens]